MAVPDRDRVAVLSAGRPIDPEVRHGVEPCSTFRMAKRVSMPSKAGNSIVGLPGVVESPYVKYPGDDDPGVYWPRGDVPARLTQDKVPRVP